MVFTVIVLATGCSSIPEAKVARPAIPKTEAECVSAGGDWTTLGLPYPGKPKICDLKAIDAGNRCSDSKQCQGICIPPEDAAVGSSAMGKCSPYLLNFGNVRELSNGRVERLNVE
jgi:hypothetical protein